MIHNNNTEALYEEVFHYVIHFRKRPLLTVFVMAKLDTNIFLEDPRLEPTSR